MNECLEYVLIQVSKHVQGRLSYLFAFASRMQLVSSDKNKVQYRHQLHISSLPGPAESDINEPSREKKELSVVLLEILQTRMRSHSIGPEMWLFV